MRELMENGGDAAAIKQLEAEAALLKIRAEMAKSEQAIAEANKKKLEAQLPTGAPAAPEGKTTTDEKFGYLAEMVAYDAVLAQAATIADQIAALPLGDAKILLVDDLDVAGADVQRLQVEQHLKSVHTALEKQIEINNELLPDGEALESLVTKSVGIAGVGAALTAVPALLGAVAGIVGMFQTDYDVKGQDFALSDVGLRAAVAGKLKAKYPVIFPALFRLESAALLDQFNEVLEMRWQLQAQVRRLRQQRILPNQVAAARLEAEIKALQQALEKAADAGEDGARRTPPELIAKQQELARLKAEQTVTETAVQQSEALIAAGDETSKALTTVPEGQRHSPLAGAILREQLDALGITHLLYLSIVSSGGEAITSKRWFSSGRTTFLGGAAVVCILAQTDGAIVTADTFVGAKRLEYQLGSEDVPKFGSREAYRP